MKVDAADLGAVRKGDKVSGHGYAVPNQAGKVFAETVQITAAQIIGGEASAKKSGHAEKKSSKAADKSDKADKAGS